MVVGVSIPFISACASAAFSPPPYIPAHYYSATEIEAQALIDAYFWGNIDWTSVNAKYNGEIYVIKNVTVDKHLLFDLNKGFIWVNQIKCYPTNLKLMKSFDLGEKIDVVGINAGPTNPIPQDVPELQFKDCVVIPAGLLTIPVDPNISPAAFGPAY